MKRLIYVGVIILGVVCIGQVEAKIVRTGFGKITRTIMTDGNTFGGCLAVIDIDIRKVAPNCSSGPVSGSTYVAFSCTGDLQSAEVAHNLFEQAQISQLMSKEIRLEVDDAKRHNGFCLVTRTEIL